MLSVLKFTDICKPMILALFLPHKFACQVVFDFKKSKLSLFLLNMLCFVLPTNTGLVFIAMNVCAVRYNINALNELYVSLLFPGDIRRNYTELSR